MKHLEEALRTVSTPFFSRNISFFVLRIFFLFSPLLELSADQASTEAFGGLSHSALFFCISRFFPLEL